jgi:hypothetical protein
VNLEFFWLPKSTKYRGTPARFSPEIMNLPKLGKVRLDFFRHPKGTKYRVTPARFFPEIVNLEFLTYLLKKFQVHTIFMLTCSKINIKMAAALR